MVTLTSISLDLLVACQPLPLIQYRNFETRLKEKYWVTYLRLIRDVNTMTLSLRLRSCFDNNLDFRILLRDLNYYHSINGNKLSRRSKP